MRLFAFPHHKPRPPGLITADTFSVIVRLDKSAITNPQLLAALRGANDGDWGGADFPEYSLTPDAIEAIAATVAEHIIP